MVDLLRDRYEPLEVVGQGGEGRVIKALDRQHDRFVALKIRPVTSEAERDVLLTEARILLAVPPHAHLPLVREDFFERDQYIIAMDWIEGTDLGRVLQGRGRPGLAPSMVLQWLADAAAALTHLHAQDPQVIHGDVKPANLILTRSGRVALVDFGLSSAPGAPRHRGGTRGYAAPERVVNGDRSRATDIYSLAATAFALLTGSPPTGIRPSWEGIDAAQAAELEAAIRLGLATDPELRPDTAGELVELMRAGWGSTLPTGVLTFCLTDLESSTAMWEANPSEMANALVIHDQLVAAAVESSGGRLLKSMGEGDATVSVFDSPRSALDASLELTRALGAVAWPEEQVLRARVALHTGEAEQRGGDYYGPTLNLAARLRGLADGGQVFLSRATADLVARHLPDGASLVDLGPTRLRGIAAPEHVYAVAAPGVEAPLAGTDCPYPGLLPFGSDDADRFFGRETLVEGLLARFVRGGLLAVVGGSGSGKSSVLRAGLAARTDASVVTPGASPLDALATADVGQPLVVDQFEELFTLCRDDDARQAFVDALLSWQAPAVIGLRADFYGACASYPELAAAVATNQVLLGPMTQDELRRAITEPARIAGLRLEPGLVDVLVGEVSGEPGALPLLSHALRATWEERDGRTLTLDAYRSTGGVRGAIAATADRAVDSLSAADRELARQLFLRLVEPGEGTQDTRRQASLEELTPAEGGDERLTRVLDAVAAARLVTVEAGTVDVAHEALIREWPRLQGWLDEDRDGLRVQRHLTTAASAWEALGRDPAELYRGTRLATALEWRDKGAHASAHERAFLAASEEDEQRRQDAQARTNRRLRGLLAAGSVALVVALIAAGVALAQAGNAATARDRADVSRIAAVARSLVERQPAVGLLLAAEAYRRHESADTESTLLGALETHPLLEGLLYGVASGLEAAVFTPDGKTLVTPTSDGTGILVWDTATRHRVATLRNDHDMLLDAAISPDGHWLAAAAYWVDGEEYGSRLEVWDLPARKLLKAIDAPAGVTSTNFTADGKTLVTQNIPIDTTLGTAVQFWDTATWTASEPWKLLDEYVGDGAVAVSGDGRFLAAQAPTGALDVWSVAEHRLVHETPATSDERVTALGFTNDGSTLAVAGEVGGISLVDPLSGAPQHAALTIPDAAPSALEFSPDRATLAVSTAQGKTQLYRMSDGQPLGPPLAANASSINDVSFSPDGMQLATAGLDRTGAIWRLDGGRAIGTATNDHSAVATEVHYTPDGRTLVTAGADGTVAIRNLAGGTVRTLDIGGEVQSVALNHAGTRLAAGGTAGQVKTFNVATGAPGPVFSAADGEWIQKVAFNPKTGIVAIGVESHPGEDVSPEATGGYVALWDPITGRAGKRIVEKGGDYPMDLAWSDDGSLLVTAGGNHLLHFYDGHTTRKRGADIDSEDAAFVSVAVSPDGTRVATGTASGIVRQWSVATHKQLGADLKGHNGWVTGVAYSRDGKTLASTTTGFSTTRLWDVAAGTPIGDELAVGHEPFTDRTYITEHYQGSRPEFSPDGKHVATPGYDGTTVLWDLQPANWLRAACRVVNRDLTRAEWRQYFGATAYRRTCT
jgi:WD40 repeat protein/class 3 adenylate cyclase/tRNA A-37 threonylcarbamoyl transferase component Bud32